MIIANQVYLPRGANNFSSSELPIITQLVPSRQGCREDDVPVPLTWTLACEEVRLV